MSRYQRQLQDTLEHDDPPPRTPPSKYETYRPSRRGRPSVREMFPPNVRDERDPHDLSLSPDHAARTSIVDNMLLSLDQFTMTDLEDYHLYNSVLNNDSPGSMAHGRHRGHTFSSSLSSEPHYEHDDILGGFMNQTAKGRRSDSDSKTGLGSIGSVREGLNSRDRTGSSQGSYSSTLDFGPPLARPQWSSGNERRSASFDYGTKRTVPPLAESSYDNEPLYNGIDAAPTPSVPAGPRKQFSTTQDTHPESLHSLNNQLSRTPVSSRKGSMSSTRTHHVRKNLHEHLGTEAIKESDVKRKNEGEIPSSSFDATAPSPSISFNKPSNPIMPTKERPGFFRRVFGKNPSPSPTQTEFQRIQEGSTTEPNEPRTSPKRVVNKKSSFFRRRKKSAADQAPPPPALLPPEFSAKSAEITKAEPSPVSSLRKVMDPFIGNPGSETTSDDVEIKKSSQKQRNSSAFLSSEPKPRYSLYPSASRDRDRSPLPPGVIRRADAPSKSSDTDASQHDTSLQRLDEMQEPDSDPVPPPLLEDRSEESPAEPPSVPKSQRAKKEEGPKERKVVSSDNRPSGLSGLPAQTGRDKLMSSSGASASEISEHPTTPNTKVTPSQEPRLDEAARDIADPSGNSAVDVPGAEDREQARRLISSQDTDVSDEPTASWLGGPDRAMVRKAYMEFFEWSGMDILAALRDMCTHLVLKGETQQVDRVLDAFSNRWCECNPAHSFKATDVVHTICYSLLLLNTDLHLADIEQKMTKSQFVRNTMPTIHRVAGEGDALPDSFGTQVEAILKDFYTSIQKNKLPLHGFQPEKEEHRAMSNNLLGPATGVLRRQGSTLSKTGTDTYPRARSADSRNGTALWSAKPRVRGRFYPSRTSLDEPSSIWNPSASSTWSKYSLGKFSSMSADSLGSEYPRGVYQQSVGFANALSQAIIREDSATSIISSEASERAAPLLEDETLELAGAPWAKEGSVKHKHHLESVDKRARDRNWNECFAVIQQGWMRLFSFNETTRTVRQKTKQRQTGGVVVGGGNWTENAEEIWKFMLRQTIASALPSPGYSKSRPHVWALSLPTGAVHLFQVGTPEIVREFVTTANYWSARLSKEPLIGGVSNIEYGWSDSIVNGASVPAEVKRPNSSADSRHSRQSSVRGSFDQQFVRPKLPADRIHISDWAPPQQSMAASSLPEPGQLNALQTYVKNVETELQKHNELRSGMSSAFSPRHPNAAKAMANWERKSSYLLREIVKFRTYVETLQTAIDEKNKIHA